MDLSKQHDPPHGHPALLMTDYLDSAEDIGDAMDQSVGVSSTSADVAVALGLALSSDTVRRWVLSSMAEMRSTAYVKVTKSSISHVACVSAPHSSTAHRSGPCTGADAVQDLGEQGTFGKGRGRAAEIQISASPMFTQQVAEHERKVLQHQMQLSDLPEPLASSTEGMKARASSRRTLTSAQHTISP